jgi:hypothetical protein
METEPVFKIFSFKDTNHWYWKNKKSRKINIRCDSSQYESVHGLQDSYSACTEWLLVAVVLTNVTRMPSPSYKYSYSSGVTNGIIPRVPYFLKRWQSTYSLRLGVVWLVIGEMYHMKKWGLVFAGRGYLIQINVVWPVLIHDVKGYLWIWCGLH